MNAFLEAVYSKIGGRNGSSLSRRGAHYRIQRRLRDRVKTGAGRLKARKNRKERAARKANKNTSRDKAEYNREWRKKKREDEKENK